MFGFSITKVIFTIVVVFAVWQAFKYFSRLQDQCEKRQRMDTKKDTSPQPGVEDMSECPVCKSYVARGSKSCGQENCPY